MCREKAHDGSPSWEAANPDSALFRGAVLIMVLIDTSVWIEYLRGKAKVVEDLLTAKEVVIHPFVIGEIACGSVANRREILSMLRGLHALSVTDDSLVLYFIDQNKLAGSGMGYIDAHLLASAVLEPPTRVLTFDKSFRAAAKAMGLEYVLAPH